MNNNFFIVEYPLETEYAEAAPIEVEYDYNKYVSCPCCGNRVSGGNWTKPREVVITKHKTPDFLYAYCDSVPFLLSEKAVDEITRAGLTGITCVEEVESVRFQRKSKNESVIPKYFHIELARSCITINHQESVIVYGSKYRNSEPCRLCRQVPATYNYFKKLSFNTSAYEGYDIFQIYELGDLVFLSQKFIDLFKSSTLSNLHYIPATEYGAKSYYFYFGEDSD